MKHIYKLALVLLALASGIHAAPRGKIISEAVTPRTITSFTAQNSITGGGHVIAKGTFAYLSPVNVGDSTLISSATWTLTSKPGGSVATLVTLPNNWVALKCDTNGIFTVKLSITTPSGTHDTTMNLVSSYYTGVGNFEGVAAQWPQCMSCHGSMPAFSAVFNEWKTSKHSQIFKNEIVMVGGHYATYCMPCHTTGYDNKVVANNNGFDDLAKQLGWKWTVETAGKWDSLKTFYPSLVNHATIGCENCHGAGKEHGMTSDKSKIMVSLDAGTCQQCHDAPWRHPQGTQYGNSLHSHAVYENSTTQGTTLSSCQRCHTTEAYIDFTKGITTNTIGWKEEDHSFGISCQACHNPHTGKLRQSPASSDTLGNGYNYGVNFGGHGNGCMDCHKVRRNVNTYITTSGTLNRTWGPHHSVQTDVFLGQQGASFNGQPFASGGHKDAIADACVDCHMAATTDTGTVMRDKVGGHSWNLRYGSYDHTKGCVSCHGPKTSFNQFVAAMDYDQDGTIEPVQGEVKGLLKKVILALPNSNDSTINYVACTTLTQRKAYWNWQVINHDGSYGIHNSKFAFDVLLKTLAALGADIPVELLSFNAGISKNIVTLTWETSTETNNKGFDIERKIGKNWEKIGFVSGKGTTTEAQKYAYNDKLGSQAGKITYRLKQVDFDGTSNYTKEVAVSYEGPGSYALSQNYPNPFNPSTMIKFNVPVESNVKLVVYNVAGQVVKTLVNGVKASGNHEVSFNLKDVNASSGIYFYSIEASSVDGSSSFRETKKMVLMK